MKKAPGFFSISFTFSLLFACLVVPKPVNAQHMDESGPLVGTWKMVAQRIVHPDRVEENLKLGETPPGGKYQIKILTNSHFAFGRMSESGEEVTAGGGRYYIKGNIYTEIIEYHTSAPLVGTEIPFTWEIDDEGRWLHTGVIGGASGFTLYEIYEKVEP